MTTNTALITGGSAGLGRALVAALSDQGWHVVTDGRDAARLDYPPRPPRRRPDHRHPG